MSDNSNLELILIDINPVQVNSWKKLFSGEVHVIVKEGDITTEVVDAIVSPANSFGFMDGGVDYAISERLGWDLQERLQAKIKSLPEGELLVGKSLVLETGDNEIPYLISSPTMRVPMSFNISTSVNAYLAMKATLIAAIEHPEINSIAIPGFCTGVGRMNEETAAFQMYRAYSEIIKGEKHNYQDFGTAQKYHFNLNPDGGIYDF